jgi:TolA-binding protein
MNTATPETAGLMHEKETTTHRVTSTDTPVKARQSASNDAPSPAASPSATGSSFSDELRAFEKAHVAFASGAVTTAASALDDYERDFPHGALSLEARVLRIEILRARGNVPEFRAKARAFLEANPSAPEARRVRNLLEQSASATSP